MFALPFTVAALLCGTINVAAAPTPPNGPYPYPPSSADQRPPWPMNNWNPASQYAPPLAPAPPHNWPPPPHPGSSPWPRLPHDHPNYFAQGPNVYHPRPAEIFKAKPSEHINPVGSLSDGAYRNHYHINMGHDHMGNVIGTPITHAPLKSLRPIMPIPPSTGLDGFAQLRHVTLPPQAAHPAYGHMVPPDAMASLNNAKTLVAAHHNAANEHALAGQALRNHQSFHEAQYSIHKHAGNHNAAADHKEQARMARHDAKGHEGASLHHTTAANSVTGEDPEALHHAYKSASGARYVHDHANLATSQHQAAVSHYQQGNNRNGDSFRKSGDESYKSASQHSEDSLWHHGRATRGHPPPKHFV